MSRGYLQSLAQARADAATQAEESARANAEPTTIDESLLAVRIILDRLYDTASPVDDLEPAAANWCDVPTRFAYLSCEECEKRSTHGYIIGKFRLCRSCATRRLVIAARLAALEGAKPEEAPQTTTERAAA